LELVPKWVKFSIDNSTQGDLAAEQPNLAW